MVSFHYEKPISEDHGLYIAGSGQSYEALWRG